jgi:hypothetical protein
MVVVTSRKKGNVLFSIILASTLDILEANEYIIGPIWLICTQFEKKTHYSFGLCYYL